jgi:hypothetical protein
METPLTRVRSRMNPTDTEILDWLQRECSGLFSCKQVRDQWQVFTVPSQHVTGSSVRDALANAMNKAATKSRRKPMHKAP